MAEPRFFDNPHFLTYVRLLRDLHEAIREGKDESEEGERIRDQMDEPGSRLTPDEIASVQGISADFYSLTEPPSNPITPFRREVADDVAESMEARDLKDFPRALDLLRRRAEHLKSAAVASLRGRIWMEAKEFAIASLYLERAAGLEPDNPNYRSVALHALLRADPEKAKRQAKDVAEKADGMPARLVLIACQIRFLEAQELHSQEEARAILISLPPVIRNAMARMVISGEDQILSGLFLEAFGMLGFCFERLGDTTEALRCFNQGLSLAPDNPLLLAARGMLLYTPGTPSAIRDLEHAIERGTSVLGPYYFLAYHSLCSMDYRKCLNLCHEGLRLEASDNVRANFYEWIAISGASLGEPRQVVEAFFRLAVGLAPSNQRIEQNYRLYMQGPSSSMNWQMDSPDEVGRFGREEFRLPVMIAA